MPSIHWFESIPGPLELFAILAGIVGSRYFIVAGLAWLTGYVWLKRRWFHRKVIQRFPSSADVRRELLYSASSVSIFGAVAALTFLAARQGWTRIYWKVEERGWGWFFASLALVIVLHDAYFYWTHRALHHPRLFRRFHRVHHLSTNPSPWAAYAFSPFEALVQASILPLAAVLLPVHPIALSLFMLWQIAFNVAGHTGYEFHPRWLMATPLRFVLNTPTNHVMHHQDVRGNFCLYFNVWDRLMRTNQPAYERRFLEVTSRPRAAASLPAAAGRDAAATSSRG